MMKPKEKAIKHIDKNKDKSFYNYVDAVIDIALKEQAKQIFNDIENISLKNFDEDILFSNYGDSEFSHPDYKKLKTKWLRSENE